MQSFASLFLLSCIVFPAGVGYVHQLRELDVSFNSLSAIPATIEECAELRSLNLADNQLTSAPAGSLESLEELRMLDLSGNQIERLPPEVQRIAFGARSVAVSLATRVGARARVSFSVPKGRPRVPAAPHRPRPGAQPQAVGAAAPRRPARAADPDPLQVQLQRRADARRSAARWVYAGSA